MTRRPSASIVANPVLVGAVTVLVITVAVFLAYNANAGLPFVPTRMIFVDTSGGSNLVPGNEVREGGFRIGVVELIEPVTLPSGQTIARHRLKLDKTVGDIPDDTRVVIRPRSALGLKYIEFTRGRSRRYLQDGDTLPLSQSHVPEQFDDINRMFDAPTRRAAQEDLAIFGSAFTGRGVSINQFIVEAKPLLAFLPPVAQALVDPSTQLVRFFREANDLVRVVRPVAEIQSQQFTDAATTFEAFSRDPQALRDTIAKSVPSLRVGIRSLAVQRPFLRDLTALSVDLRFAARDLRAALPTINDALEVGTPVLRRTPELNALTRDTLREVKRLSEAPTTNEALRALTHTVGILNPLVRFLGPYQTVCNYWNYWWTYIAEHLSEEDPTGMAQRANVNHPPPGVENNVGDEEAYAPMNGEPNLIDPAPPGDPIEDPRAKKSFTLHAQPYSGAIDNQGNADCEKGQAGYMTGGLAPVLENRRDFDGKPFRVVAAPRTPGNQGPTYEGRNKVPDGQTFSREPEGPAAARLDPAATTGIYSGDVQ
jgi:virulence factor Mce-like protein